SEETTAATTDASRCRKLGASDTLGYALHFSNVPTLSSQFLNYLKQHFDGSFLNALVCMPHKRRDIVIPAQLIVQLRADNSVFATSNAFATIGAKRVCLKVQS